MNLHGHRGVVPEGAEYIGRACNHKPWRLRRSKWHNPFRGGTPEENLARYEQHLHDSGLINDIHELRGRDLACWCAPGPCHGDALLRLANEPIAEASAEARMAAYSATEE